MKPASAHLAILLCSLFLLSSCFTKEVTKTKYRDLEIVKYLVFEFESDNLDSDFIFQDSSLKISYRTQDKWDFDIENTSDVPIYLDVGRSSLIVNKISYNYLKALDNNERYYYLPNQSQFIMKNFQENLIDVLLAIHSTIDDFKKENISFTKQSSPLTIRSHITYGTDQNIFEEKRIDNLIWLSSVNIVNAPSVEKREIQDSNNRYYFKYSETESESFEITETVPNQKAGVIFMSSLVGAMGIAIAIFMTSIN